MGGRQMRMNSTRNQHFLPQIEQTLNAINPGSASGKFRIYSFRIQERESYKITLENPRGHLISSTLSMLDLFSFDVPKGGRIRMNLEELFHKYEANIEVHTKNLVEKLSKRSSDIKVEVVELFAAKLLNFVRNPYCIEKVLNSFPLIETYEPVDPGLLAIYRRILAGRKPHQAHLCRELRISKETYIRWLRLLFMLLAPLSSAHPTMFEGVIKGLFENRNTQAFVFAWIYDEDCVLLSDRGFCQVLPDGNHMSMSFNLCSTAFIDYIFLDAATVMKDRVSPEVLDGALNLWRKRPVTTVNVAVKENDRDALVRYNRHVIEWSRERVYCAVKSGIVFS